MKKIITMILTFILVLSCFSCASATTAEIATPAAGAAGTGEFTMEMQIGNPTMTVNGGEKEIDPGIGTTPIIQNSRTLLPVRAVVEEMGGQVAWDGETQTVTLAMNDTVIVLKINSTTAFLNEEERTLDAAPVIINNRTMLPIRFIAEGFGFDVAWDQKTTTVTLTKGGEATLAGTADTLVIYFSRTGTTEDLAEVVRSASGADLAEITMKTPYSENYNECLEQVQAEKNSGTLPEIVFGVDSLEQYDTILLGYPIWYNSVANPVEAFLTSNDLSGKTIMPFCTSGGSGISGSLTKIRELCPNSTITAGFEGNSTTTEATVTEWLTANGR